MHDLVLEQEEDWKTDSHRKHQEILQLKDLINQLRNERNKFEFDADQLSKQVDELHGEL